MFAQGKVRLPGGNKSERKEGSARKISVQELRHFKALTHLLCFCHFDLATYFLDLVLTIWSWKMLQLNTEQRERTGS